MDVQQKTWLFLQQFPSVQLASITSDGYPRICEMQVVKAQSLTELYFATAASANKVAQFKQNSKSGVACAAGDDGITLTGTIEIVHNTFMRQRIFTGEYEKLLAFMPDGTDKYCLLQFTAHEATVYLNGVKATFSL